jgi:hypothetical protein
MTNSIDRDQWFNVTSESRDRILPFFFNFVLGRNRTRDPRVAEPKRTPLGYILPIIINFVTIWTRIKYLVFLNINMEKHIIPTYSYSLCYVKMFSLSISSCIKFTIF